MSDGRYVRFAPKMDDANQVISAEHINTLQDTAERTQQGLFKAQDRDFLDKALFLLEHHRGVNGLWLDMFEDVNKIDLPKTQNLVFSEVEQGVVFPDNALATGILYSRPYINPNATNMKKVMVIASGSIPAGTNIKVEISNNDVDWFEVPTVSGDLFEIPTDGSKLRLRAKFDRVVGSPSPRLDAWAILYYDVKSDIIEMPDGSQVVIADPTDPTEYTDIVKIMHHQLLGIGPDDHHPEEHTHDGTDGSGLVSHDSLTDIGEDDHHTKDHTHGEDGVSPIDLGSGSVIGTLPTENLSYQVWTGKPGTTGLYFDPNLGDRLVYVKTPDDETYLFYDLVNDRLSHTITIRDGVAVWETMVYGNYTTSTGEVNVVLQGTEKQMYDANDSVIQAELDGILAPDAPIGLMASDPGTGGTIDLTWAANTELDLAGYNIYKSLDGGMTWSRLNLTGVISAPNFSVTGLIDGRSYTYAVTAVDTSGFESRKSAGVVATSTLVDTIAPGQVQTLTVASIGGGAIKLDWDLNTEADMANYYVYRSFSGAAGTFSRIQTVAQPNQTFTETGLIVGNTYFYYVTAVDTNGNESVPSIIVSMIA